MPPPPSQAMRAAPAAPCSIPCAAVAAGHVRRPHSPRAAAAASCNSPRTAVAAAGPVHRPRMCSLRMSHSGDKGIFVFAQAHDPENGTVEIRTELRWHISK
ncbi:hypothetical protein GUJ93_ZPchr0013g35984 [Zizania palustris]|uniref:Uncharacterized protein n=1 Tax=Zizania palustris TaxID=103762 RepID=A0A8J5WVC1_ZIZPA|nr:hypothetical protein GUJ93_ZPchr0013g35984 [Zizania palustris]